jgi:hypothetical protein
VRPAALVYLRDDLAAQRMVVAWPLLTRDGKQAPSLNEWSKLASVPRHVVARIAPVLQAHEIVRADGTVDPLAEQFVTAQVQSTLRGARR